MLDLSELHAEGTFVVIFDLHFLKIENIKWSTEK